MEFYTLGNRAIAEELGRRIRLLRLKKNTTQKELASSTTLSINAIKSLESGRGKLSTLIAVLRELQALDQLDNFLPETEISPLQLAKMQGKVRERASGERLKNSPNDNSKDDSEW